MGRMSWGRKILVKLTSQDWAHFGGKTFVSLIKTQIGLVVLLVKWLVMVLQLCFGMKSGLGTNLYVKLFLGCLAFLCKKNETIHDMGHLDDGRWRWEFRWRRELFVWEEEQLREFLESIATFFPSGIHDRWIWLEDDTSDFSVNSAYLLLAREFNQPVVHDAVLNLVFKKIWKSGAPSKVGAFAWQLLLNRIPTKDNLLKRRIIQTQQGRCVMCGLAPETAIHLLFHCPFAAKVWYKVMGWLGFIIIIPHNIASSLAILLDCAKNKKEKVGLCLIWSAYIWVLWSVRNNCIFNNGAVNLEEVVDHIKLLSWKWFIGRVAKGSVLLYEWNWEPLICMKG
ncbi:hypothetical protein QL285_073614 [Trifolium repens]|nr:hypothetical protein QL285_073614 [Trifolium repens]